MKQILFNGLWLIGIAYLALAAWMFFAQRSLMYFPDRSVPDPAAAGFPDMTVVSYTTEDGLDLSAWYKEAPAGKPTVVYFHGNAGNLHNHSWVARPLIGAGYGVLLVEYRGYGGNPGAPTEDGLYADGRAALAFLDQKGVGMDGIVLFGQSLGTGVAVKLAAETAPKALILQSPYTSIADVGQRAYWYMPVKLLAKDRFDSKSRIGGVTAPLYVVYAEEDEIVPPDITLALFDAAGEPKTIEAVPGARHNDLGSSGGIEKVLAFLAGL